MADSPFPADFDPSGGIAGIYNAFEPSETAREEFYVQLEAVRGGWDILRELGKRIERSQHPTHQLYSRSEEHTSELQSRPHISYAVFCLKKKKTTYPPPPPPFLIT